MVSKAYKEGLSAKSLYDCPYDKSSDEYNDFERGFVQMLKRTPDHFFRNESGPIGEPSPYHNLRGSQLLDEKPPWKGKSYAEARKK
ncbi:hypothetical protein QDG88_13320 [Pseudoalteromonas piscicida]|uniref:hypothetical protein n=1 Tax=Pseudoalteromonas piscicida TaxID=43662 RepID=UPI00273A21EA|nr:hypothetical protein [Pseudoalteromonas piscicida]MDP4488901.1 hypothetical protein [Pseudoalteromonas piscicida]